MVGLARCVAFDLLSCFTNFLGRTQKRHSANGTVAAHVERLLFSVAIPTSLGRNDRASRYALHLLRYDDERRRRNARRFLHETRLDCRKTGRHSIPLGFRLELDCRGSLWFQAFSKIVAAQAVFAFDLINAHICFASLCDSSGMRPICFVSSWTLESRTE